MRQALSKAATVLIYVSLIGIVGSSLYGLAKVGKTVSYQWWYRDMVKQTVIDLVKESALK